MNRIDWLVVIGLVVFVLPVVAYVLAKTITTGILMARQQFPKQFPKRSNKEEDAE